MVSYCCVKGCNNNTNNAKKEPTGISFHAFPSNLEARQKWLQAIGRPDWDPPSHVRICSVHFSCDQINQDGYRIRIKEEAFPVNVLPPNSFFEASHIDVCRICLEADVKMFSLREGLLKVCIDNLTGFKDSNVNIEGLPQCVCYLCGAQLLKYYKLVEKSMIAQSTLLDIFANHGQISKDLIKQRDRKQLNLQSTLGIRLPEYDIVHTKEYNYEGFNDDCIALNENKDDLQSKLGIRSPKSSPVVTCLQNGNCIELSENKDNIEIELKDTNILSEKNNKKGRPRKSKRLVPNKKKQHIEKDKAETSVIYLTERLDSNIQDDDFKNSTELEYPYTSKLENEETSENCDNGATYSDSDSSESDDSIVLSKHKKRLKKTSEIKQPSTEYCDVGSLDLNIDGFDFRSNQNKTLNKLNTKQAQSKNSSKRKSNVQKTDSGNNEGKVLNIKKKEVKQKSDKTQKDGTFETTKEKKVKQTAIAKNPEGKTPEEISIETLKCFNIVDISLQEQIEQWKKEIEEEVRPNWIFKCEVCSKKLPRKKTYEKHVAHHDPVRGDSVCPVCKERFRNETRLIAHTIRVHSKRYECKNCSKVYHDFKAAKRHDVQHSGEVYQCGQCPFTTRQRSVVWLHRRKEHARGHHCARCGRGFVNARGLTTHIAVAHPGEVVEPKETIRCEECDITFYSEGAKRVHILTYKQHKNRPSRNDPMRRTTCSRCGECFPSWADMLQHKTKEHPITKYDYSHKNYSKGKTYPRTCDHCDVEVKTRMEHYWHVRKNHPSEKYCPDTSVVCEKCGKGFQNISLLRYHESTHSETPNHACPTCPRRFYNEPALRRHLTVHTALRPHVCRHCGRAFREKNNLQRHTRMHTGETPYECKQCGKKFKYWETMDLHRKHSHLKMPWPPRVRRNVKHKAKPEATQQDDSFN